jgi:hypothetical protein
VQPNLIGLVSESLFNVMAKRTRYEIGDREIDGDDYFVVIAPVYFSVSIYDSPARYEADLARFSTEQRLVLAYHWYLSEVNNGGHDQFYFNSTGIVWRDALRTAAAIGPPEMVPIIKESANRLGGNPSLDREEREEQLEQMNGDFRDLDEELFRVQEQANFDDRFSEFIRAHRESFFFSGIVEEL